MVIRLPSWACTTTRMGVCGCAPCCREPKPSPSSRRAVAAAWRNWPCAMSRACGRGEFCGGASALTTACRFGGPRGKSSSIRTPTAMVPNSATTSCITSARAPTCGLSRAWAPTSCRWAMPRATSSMVCALPCGPRMPRGSAWWAASTPGTAGATRCACGMARGCGRSSSPMPLLGIRTSTRSCRQKAACCP